jgi:hypothetical protein
MHACLLNAAVSRASCDISARLELSCGRKRTTAQMFTCKESEGSMADSTRKRRLSITVDDGRDPRARRDAKPSRPLGVWQCARSA